MQPKRRLKAVERIFRCEECYGEYETKAQARKCGCSIEWECTWCGEIFDNKKDATKCCKDSADE